MGAASSLTNPSPSSKKKSSVGPSGDERTPTGTANIPYGAVTSTAFLVTPTAPVDTWNGNFPANFAVTAEDANVMSAELNTACLFGKAILTEQIRTFPTTLLADTTTAAISDCGEDHKKTEKRLVDRQPIRSTRYVWSLSGSSDDEGFICVICCDTITDPVMLECLHGACRSCTYTKTDSVTCPECGVTTALTAVKDNLILASCAHRSSVLQNVSFCHHCIDDNKQIATAVKWCYTCQYSLCPDALKYHNTAHRLIHLDSNTPMLELYRPPVLKCTEHDEEKTHTCFTCQDGVCSTCAHNCYQRKHDVHPFGHTAAKDRMTNRVTDVHTTLSGLNDKNLLLQAYLNLPDRVATAKQQSLAELSNAKRTALDSVCRAHDKAEKLLSECWTVLERKAKVRNESAKILRKRLDWTTRYCQFALLSVCSPDDISRLLPQLGTIGSCLGVLQAEIITIKAPVDPLKLVSPNLCLPTDLDMITIDWFGQATLLNENFESPESIVSSHIPNDYHRRKVLVLRELEELLKSEKEKLAERNSAIVSKEVQLDSAKKELSALRTMLQSQQKELESERMTAATQRTELTSTKNQLASVQNELEQRKKQCIELTKELEIERKKREDPQAKVKAKTQLLTLSKLLCFDEKPQRTFSTFSGPGSCWDVAVTRQGGLLVAAMADGLEEYEAATYRKIATWKPAAFLFGDITYSWVLTVDCLADGRAVVGITQKRIVLLQRSQGDDAWRVVQRINADLQGRPRRLSACCDRLLAVLEDRYNFNSPLIFDQGVLLLSLSDGKQLHRQKLDYAACSVALIDPVFIVCSNDQVEMTGSSGKKSKSYVVDCYSYAGLRLWRHVVAGGLKVWSLCSDSVGRLLYAAKRGSVVALSVDDGRELSTALKLSTKETEQPYAVAVDKAGLRLLALISFGGGKEPNTIATFDVQAAN